MSARFYADPIIAAALAEPDTDYLGELQAKNDRLFAALHDEHDELVVLDLAAMDAYLAGADRDFDVTTEAA